jgi:hypothetical protein
MFTITNTPVHKLEQGVLQDDLQTLIYDLDDIRRPSHKIEEIIEF